MLQALAFGRQFALGFRPFHTAPQRVPLSWDMFAIDIERCDIRWSPPLQIDGTTIPSLHALSAPFEWDVVYNTREHYRAVAKYACVTSAPGPDARKRYRLTCWIHPPVPDTEDGACE